MPDEAEELADVAPEAFVAARDDLAKRLRRDGRKDDAAAVKQLRKPTVPRWVAGQIRRHHADAVDALRAASQTVADAQEAVLTGGDRSALRDAMADRRDAVRRLGDVVAGVLTELDRPAHHRDEVLGELEADVTAEVSTGVFGVRDDLELPDRSAAEQRAREHEAEQRAAEERAAIESAEDRVSRARDELARAEEALAAAKRRYEGQ